MAVGLLALFIIQAVLFVASALLMPRPKLQGVSPTMPRRPTSKEGVPIPVVWGTVLIPANVTHFSDVAAVEQVEKVQTGLFSSHRVTVGYSYSAMMQCVLCHGPVDALHDIIFQDILGLNDSREVTVNVNVGGAFTPTTELQDYISPSLPATPPGSVDLSTELIIFAQELFGGYKHGGGASGIATMYWGGNAQPSDPTLAWAASISTADYPAYRGIAHIVFGRKVPAFDPEPFNFGEFGTVPPLSFLVRRCPSNLGLGSGVTNINGGANLAEMCYETLINTVWGLCVPASEIETSTFIACANTLAAEGFGCHLSLSDQNTGDEILTELLRYADGQIQQNPVTGKLEMSLNRNDYDPLTILSLDDNNSTSVITRPSWTSLVNQVKVMYTGQRGVKFVQVPTQPVDDIAAQREFGVVHALTIPYLGVQDPVIANRLAVRDLRRGATPLKRARVIANREAAGLMVGKPFKITNAVAGVSNHVFRAVSLNFGTRVDGKIEIDALEDIFNLESPFYNTPIDPPPGFTGVGPTGPIKVTVTPSHDETTGYLLLEFVGGDGLITAVQFSEQTGEETPSPWHDNVTPDEFSTFVDLDEKHASVIEWRIIGHLKDGTDGVLADGKVDYGLSTRPAKPGVSYTIDAGNMVDLTVTTDRDAANLRYAVAYDHVPTLAEVLLAANIPVEPDHSQDIPNIILLDASNPVAYVSVVALDAAGNNGQLTSVTMHATSAGSSGLAMKLFLQKASDSILTVFVYLADSSFTSGAARMIRAAGQGVTGVLSEDGLQSSQLGSRGTLIQQPSNLTIAPWVATGTGTRTLDNAQDAPDLRPGVSKLRDTGSGGYYVRQQIGSGNFNTIPVSGRVWLKSSAPTTVDFGFYDQTFVPAGASTYASVNVTNFWQEFEFDGTVDHTTTELHFFVKLLSSGIDVLVWGTIGIRGQFAPVAPDLDDTDYVKFTVTRPPRDVTARNLLLQSDTIGTAPWAIDGGSGVVTDNAITVNGLAFSLVDVAAASFWGQYVVVEQDGKHCIGFKAKAFPGVAGTLRTLLYDYTSGLAITRVDLIIAVDGTMTFDPIVGGVGGELLTLEAEGNGVYQAWYRTAVLDKTHTYNWYPANNPGADKYYISRTMMIAGPNPFPGSIKTTTEKATETVPSPSGLVTFTGTRNGLAPVSQSLNVEPAGVSGQATPLITIEQEGTARGGTKQGMVRVIVQFTERVNEVHIYTTESELSAGAVPSPIDDHYSGAITRLEGVIANDVNFRAEFDIATTENWYRQILALIYSGPTGKQISVLAPSLNFEGQAIDTGIGPTAAPSALSVIVTIVNGIPRATISFTINDAAAQHRVFRNGIFLIRLAVGDNGFVDDGLTPGKDYTYTVDAIRNGQTSALSASATDASTTPTLPTPTWQTGYPTGGGGILGEPAFVNARWDNPDPQAGTELYMSTTPADAAPWVLVGSFGSGLYEATINGPDVGTVTGDDRYFYLVSKRLNYDDSAESVHKLATFRPSL